MSRVLLVEDSPSSVGQASKLLQELGVKDVQVAMRVDAATSYLQEAIDGKKPLPDLIILDLIFENDNGLEVLRLWRSSPKLRPIRIVVWTRMGEVFQEVCRHFGAAVVPKDATIAELKAAILANLTSAAA